MKPYICFGEKMMNITYHYPTFDTCHNAQSISFFGLLLILIGIPILILLLIVINIMKYNEGKEKEQ